MIRSIVILLTIVGLTACSNTTENPKEKKPKSAPIPTLNYTLVNQFPHSTSSFTEGFLIHNDQLFESTGSPSNIPQTRSIFGIVNKETGEIDVKNELDRNTYFGEGIVILQNKLYQLTYKKQTCFVYDLTTFREIEQYQYANEEGWGMTTDGKYIIMSDGTHTLSFRDPANFKVVKTLAVSENSYATSYLNELEYIKGYIYANIWPTNKIVKIDPKSGKVVGKIDLTHLRKLAAGKNPYAQETNGIAYDPASNTLLVTGKMWPEVFQIKLSGI